MITHTTASLPVTQATFDEIKGKLKAAGYDDVIDEDRINMHGLALVVDDEPLQSIAPPPRRRKSDAQCTYILAAQGKGYPRTCRECGITGPCKRGYTESGFSPNLEQAKLDLGL